MKKNTFFEVSGSLTPELEGAPLTQIHPTRTTTPNHSADSATPTEEGESH